MSAATSHTAPGSLPRPLLILGVPLAGILLVSLFFFLGFPWKLLGDALAVQASLASGARVVIDDLGPGLSPLGPVLEARGVAVALPDGSGLRLDRARLRPAWSLSWLRAAPAVAVDLTASEGRVRGTLYAGSRPGFDGRIEAVELAQLPLAEVAPGFALDGVADGELDLRMGDLGPEGQIDLRARSGSLALPGLPLAFPFESLAAAGELGGKARLRLDTLVLDGPLLSLTGTGEVGNSPQLDAAPLSARLRIEVREESVRPIVSNLGVQLDSQGRADVQVGGTVGRPTVR